MVDKDDIFLNVNINYNNDQIINGRIKDLPSLDEIKNKIMKKLDIPNTKDYLFLSYKDDKGSVQGIGEDENIFKYAKEKPNSHQTEYILNLDLRISDEINKFKKFFNGVIDENKYNETKNELDKVIKENEIIKKKIEEMEKSKIEELEKTIKRINDMKMKVIKKQKIENNKLQIKLYKKELENNKLIVFINGLPKKIKEHTNKIIEFAAKKIQDEIKNNKDNYIINLEQLFKYINDLKEGMKELNEKNIKYKNSLQKIKLDLEKEKSLNSSKKKESEFNDSILNGKDGVNLEVANNNEQNIEKKPQDGLRNKNKNNNKNKIININDDELLKQDKFLNFLNDCFFKSQNQYITQNEQITLKKYHSELKENALKKLKTFYDIKIIPILDSKIHLNTKNFLEKKKKEIENYLKSLDKNLDKNKTLKQNDNIISVKEKNYTQYIDNKNINQNNQKNVIYNNIIDNSNINKYQIYNDNKLTNLNPLSKINIIPRYKPNENNIYNENRLTSQMDYINNHFEQNNYGYKTQYNNRKYNNDNFYYNYNS